jgi:N-methylhydantoinase A
LPRDAPDFVTAVREAFEAEYASRFGTMTLPRRGRIEIITFRVEALVAAVLPPPAQVAGRTGGALRPTGTRRVFTRQYGAADAAIHDGASLLAGDAIAGPALVARADTTIFIPAGHRAEVDGWGHLHIDVRNAR